jgi:hypothetical protein
MMPHTKGWKQREVAGQVNALLRAQTIRQGATIEHFIKRDLIWQICVASLLYRRACVTSQDKSQYPEDALTAN